MTDLEQCRALQRAGRLDEAERGYRCLAAVSDEAASSLAALLLQQARYDEAVTLLEPLAARRPDDAGVAINLSIALRHCGRADDALGRARRLPALAPRDVRAWNAYGLAALDGGAADEALAAFESGLRLAAGHPALGLHRAQCLRRLGRVHEAIGGFEAVVAAAPQLLEGWRGLAASQAAVGDARAALYSRERALRLAPSQSDIVLEYAAAALGVGDAGAAVTRLSALLDTGADDARAWTWLGRAHLQRGEATAARAAFERARERDPTAAHFHAALSGALPDGVESDYIRELFDDFADRFERTLEGLRYSTPSRIARLLDEQDVRAATVLDLGCGTGLMATALAHPGRRIDGVDLSARMLAHARAKGCYRELHHAEILDFLHRTTAHWELIVAADVFIYTAELPPVFKAVFDRLHAGGWFAFSLERSDGASAELDAATGRYRHAPAVAVAALEDAGFTDVRCASIVLRQEAGRPVAGELVLARRADRSTT